MRRAAAVVLWLSSVSVSVAGEGSGVVLDFDPTSPGLHDYAPPTPVGRGYGNAYLGAGYMEFLYSGPGGRAPHLPPRRVYVGPVESQP